MVDELKGEVYWCRRPGSLGTVILMHNLTMFSCFLITSCNYSFLGLVCAFTNLSGIVIPWPMILADTAKIGNQTATSSSNFLRKPMFS